MIFLISNLITDALTFGRGIPFVVTALVIGAAVVRSGSRDGE